MTQGRTTWAALVPPDGAALLVVNSAEGDEDQVSAALDALGGVIDISQLYVIAGSRWREWLRGRAVPAQRTLFAADEEGRDVEVYHFLLSSRAIGWIGAARVRTFMGTMPHDVLNEVVHDALEWQVCLLIGDGRLIAHSLPSHTVYVFDAAMLVRRVARPLILGSYRKRASLLLGSLQEAWRSGGVAESVSSPDGQVDDRTLSMALSNVGLASPRADVLEDAGTSVARAVAARLEGVRELLQQRDLRLAAFEAVLQERNQAVAHRDALLVQERDRYARTFDARVRRVAGRVSRLLKGK